MKKYDLEERTAQFSEAVINFIKSIKQNAYNTSIINQLIRSATSVGANYYEAIGASSIKDFRNKIYICRKEIQETKYWLRIVSQLDESCKEKARLLWKEAQELTLIFSKITSQLNKKYKFKN